MISSAAPDPGGAGADGDAGADGGAGADKRGFCGRETSEIVEQSVEHKLQLSDLSSPQYAATRGRHTVFSDTFLHSACLSLYPPFAGRSVFVCFCLFSWGGGAYRCYDNETKERNTRETLGFFIERHRRSVISATISSKTNRPKSPAHKRVIVQSEQM